MKAEGTSPSFPSGPLTAAVYWAAYSRPSPTLLSTVNPPLLWRLLILCIFAAFTSLHCLLLHLFLFWWIIPFLSVSYVLIFKRIINQSSTFFFRVWNDLRTSQACLQPCSSSDLQTMYSANWPLFRIDLWESPNRGCWILYVWKGRLFQPSCLFPLVLWALLPSRRKQLLSYCFAVIYAYVTLAGPSDPFWFPHRHSWFPTHMVTVKAKWNSMDVSKFLTVSTHLECCFFFFFFPSLLSLTRLSLRRDGERANIHLSF